MSELFKILNYVCKRMEEIANEKYRELSLGEELGARKFKPSNFREVVRGVKF